MSRKVKSHILSNSSAYSKVLLVFGFICALTASLTSGDNMEGIPWDYSYYHLNAIAFTSYLTAFYLIILQGTPEWSRGWANFTLLVQLCALSTIGDELALNGSDVDLQDFIRIAATLLIYFFSKRKREKKENG